MVSSDIICSLSTPRGVSAISIIRISGQGCIELIDNHIFKSKKGNKLIEAKSSSINLGDIYYQDEHIDEALFSVFRSPHSYTGEDIVEISIHGSLYIQNRVIIILNNIGIRLAKPGEYTFRAFWNNKINLSKAEFICDLINSDSKSSHDIAIRNMRGGITNKIREIRKSLIEILSLIELELDFSEEDIEYTNRDTIILSIKNIYKKLERLIDSFNMGNAIKNGVGVCIIGAPNSGKSTLLNYLLNDNRVIVSDLEGTTRDLIEEKIYIDGVCFRFIDTAGIRKTNDKIELIGINKTYDCISKSEIIIHLYDCNTKEEKIYELFSNLDLEGKIIFNIANKVDKLGNNYKFPEFFILKKNIYNVSISCKTGYNIDFLKKIIVEKFYSNYSSYSDEVVTNLRHYNCLKETYNDVKNVFIGLKNNIYYELISVDIRKAINNISNITEGFDLDKEVLEKIFSRFCIGK